MRWRAVGALLSLCALWANPGRPTTPAEYEIKAAFLYNFAKFIEWPPQTGQGEPDAFVITILGQDPFDGVIDDMLQGKTVNSRRVVVRRASRADDVRSSQILFISDSERAQLADILKRFANTATLTVGESDRFAERGGIICFRMEKDRIRLDINLAVAERARLRISSELLKLARIVGQGPAD